MEQRTATDRIWIYAKWIGIGFLLFIFYKMCTNDVEPRTASSNYITVRSTSSTGAKMAAIDRGSKSLPKYLVSKYESHLSNLKTKCIDSESKIGDMIMASQKTLYNSYNQDRSLLELLEFAEEMMNTPEVNRQSCAEPFALMVLTIGSDNK